MLPDVEAHDGELAFHDRAVLIGAGDDVDLAAGFTSQAQPDPKRVAAAALNFSLKASKLPKVVDRGRDVADGRAAAAGLHDGPEHRVVDVAAAVVAHGGADVLGNDGAVVGQQFLHGLAGEIGRDSKRLVEVGDVGVVVLAVVDLHGHLVDVRFERVRRVGQRWKCKWHVFLLYLLDVILRCVSNASAIRNIVVSSKCLRENLHSNRQPFGGLSAGYAHARDSGETTGDGVNVREVHGQRVVHLLAQLECRERRNRRDEASTSANARAKSRAISARTFCAFK